MWVLGDGDDGFLDLADIRFDFKRITVAELAQVNEGVVAFTTPLQTLEMVRSVLATSARASRENRSMGKQRCLRCRMAIVAI